MEIFAAAKLDGVADKPFLKLPQAAIGRQYDLIALPCAHEAQAALALVQLAITGQTSHWTRPSSKACQ